METEQENETCLHEWQAGMVYVHDEDLPHVAPYRKVECWKCEKTPKKGEDY